MKNLHIENSYNIWDWIDMQLIIQNACLNEFGSYDPKVSLNRTYNSMYIEWWLHNIGYYVTLPLCGIEKFRQINLRFKDVDLEEWV